MNHFHTTGTPAVYRRTTKGQFAAASPGAAGTGTMDSQHRRLLLLVNGYTTLDAIARVGQFEARPEMLAQDLEAHGLIEQAAYRGSRQEMSDRQAVMGYAASGPPWPPGAAVPGIMPGTVPMP